jgi:uncharacterized membrane protein HdeD (DUF308 family)
MARAWLWVGTQTGPKEDRRAMFSNLKNLGEHSEGAAMSTSTVGGVVRLSANWAIALSILMIVAGILAILVPPVAGIAAAILVAWLLCLSGVAHLVFSWHMHTRSGVLWELAVGALYLAMGIYLLVRPVTGLVSLTLLLAGYLFVKGVLECILAFGMRGRGGMGFLILDAIVSLILGVMIWQTWPVSSEWAIGTLIGISMVFAGVSRLSLAVGARRVAASLP